MVRGRCVSYSVFEKGTLDHHRYIKEVLSVALRYRNSKFGRNNWTFQQDNGTAHTHQETQEWCCQHFPSFLDKNTWPAKSRFEFFGLLHLGQIRSSHQMG